LKEKTMPGPLPKPAYLRQRTNKSASRAILQVRGGALDKPMLPDGDWHPMAVDWWEDVWASPMSAEFLQGDVPALYRLVSLVDVWWNEHKLDVAKEIRLLEREFGLTPLARRRLEWQVAVSEEKKEQHGIRRSKRAVIVNGDDPRKAL
jgi:hypothetical protein